MEDVPVPKENYTTFLVSEADLKILSSPSSQFKEISDEIFNLVKKVKKLLYLEDVFKEFILEKEKPANSYTYMSDENYYNELNTKNNEIIEKNYEAVKLREEKVKTYIQLGSYDKGDVEILEIKNSIINYISEIDKLINKINDLDKKTNSIYHRQLLMLNFFKVELEKMKKYAIPQETQAPSNTLLKEGGKRRRKTNKKRKPRKAKLSKSQKRNKK
jgi:hypothetical protein